MASSASFWLRLWNVLFWKKCLWCCYDFLGHHSNLAPGNCTPLPPSLRLWFYARKIGKFFENKQIFKSERHELLFHEHLQFSNTIRHRSCTDCQQRLLTAFQVSSCSFCITSMPAPRVFSAWSCVCFSNNKTFPNSTSYFFTVRQVWE